MIHKLPHLSDGPGQQGELGTTYRVLTIKNNLDVLICKNGQVRTYHTTSTSRQRLSDLLGKLLSSGQAGVTWCVPGLIFEIEGKVI